MIYYKKYLEFVELEKGVFQDNDNKHRYFFEIPDFVEFEDFRNKKIGEALLSRAKEYCIQNKAKGLALETAIDNPAQKLYEKLAWIKDVDCFHYFWTSNQ